MNQGSRRQENEDAGRSERGRRDREQGPFGGMSPLTREIDRMFDSLWRNPFGLLASRGGRWNGGEALDARWSPELEMHEHEGEFVVRVDLPGMRREDVDVEVVGQTLVIQGERRQDCESDGDGWHHSECRYGRFVRSVPLPENVDAEQVRAQFHDGILELRMPAPEAKESRRRIPIGEAGSEPAGAAPSRGRSTTSRRGEDAPEST